MIARVLPAIVAAAASALLSAQTLSAPSAEDVAAAIERELKIARIPGASFAVVTNSGAVVRSYGVADVSSDAAMRPETLLQVGSLNKLLTAIALTSTLDQQRISLDEPIGKRVPGLSSQLAAVTFHQLLSQTSGLRDQPGAGGTSDEGALEKRVRAIGDADFLLPPGTVFSYSNLGYAAAGHALQHLRKRPYADAMTDAVIRPLGMQRSTMRLEEATRRSRGSGHRLEKDAAVPTGEVDNDTSVWPAGYLWTNAAEILPLLRALSGAGEPPRGLEPRIVSLVTRPHTPMPNVFVGGHYGYGLMTAKVQGVSIYEHGGTQRGFSSILRVAPGNRFGVVILTNLDNAPLRNVAQKVMAEALGLPDPAPLKRAESAVTPKEIEGLTGVYRNRGTAELALRDGQVVLMLDDSPPMAVTRLGDHRYVARPRPGVGGLEFVLQPATSTTPSYLHFALWAYVRSSS